jgi:hypothetical protein
MGEDRAGRKPARAAAVRTRIARFPGVCAHTHAPTHLNGCRAGAHAGRARSWMGGQRERVRGGVRDFVTCGFSSLMKQKKKGKICFVIYIAGKRFFLYIFTL